MRNRHNKNMPSQLACWGMFLLGNEILDISEHLYYYVNGNVYTNRLETFWNLTKHPIICTYVSIKPFHLFRYLDEETFRFNNLKVEDGTI